MITAFFIAWPLIGFVLFFWWLTIVSDTITVGDLIACVLVGTLFGPIISILAFGQWIDQRANKVIWRKR